jgi:hypothetical protein
MCCRHSTTVAFVISPGGTTPRCRLRRRKRWARAVTVLAPNMSTGSPHSHASHIPGTTSNPRVPAVLTRRAHGRQPQVGVPPTNLWTTFSCSVFSPCLLCVPAGSRSSILCVPAGGVPRAVAGCWGGRRSSLPFRGIVRLHGTGARFARWPRPRVPPLARRKLICLNSS